ncbi:MAG: stage II sporulation protein M [Propionibacteriaceae bacterium]|jgi:uncharacterized membrane protein SpoIIM required for sporulation|nr:stage II sporulation protein M [Propionibacteriaceae bacterium]
MDVDVFANARAERWAELERLSKTRKLTGKQADRLVALYRQTSTDLSALRTNAPDPALVSRLSVLLTQARARIQSPHSSTWVSLSRFLYGTLPAAFYRIRWWSVAVTAACVLVAAVSWIWVMLDPTVLDQIMDPASQRRYVEESFEEYYSAYPSWSFSMKVWTNNALIAAVAVASGVTGIYPAYILFGNSFNLGATGALMQSHDAAVVFWSLILPHGLLELSACFVAGACGMRLCWAWLVPGRRSRLQSLAEEGKSAMVVVVGLAGALFVSGLIEGFITGYGLPGPLKIAIGVLACAAFWIAIFPLGRWAVQHGFQPTLVEEEAESYVPTV